MAPDGINVSLMNMYAPNEDRPAFIKKISNVIAQYTVAPEYY